MDNNFTPISPESESAVAAASEEATIYTPPTIVREKPQTPTETEIPVASEGPVEPTPALEKKSLDFAKIFSSPLYLAICILTTVLFSFTIIRGDAWLFPLLFMIAGWVTFGKAKKKEAPVSGIKFTHGVITAEYVLTYVAGGLVILAGIGLIAVHFTLNMTFKDMIDAVVSGAEQSGAYSIPSVGDAIRNAIANISEGYQYIVSSIASVGIAEEAIHGILFITFSMSIALCGALMLLFNVLCTRKICLLARSLAENAQNPDAEILKARAVKNWLMVIGIFTAIGVLNFHHIMTIGVTSALYICGSVFVKKNFAEE